MKTFSQLVEETRAKVKEIFPWDLVDRLKQEKVLIVDIREPYEYDAMHIPDTLNVPRGILETACEYDFEETVPELVEARDKEVVVVCRSGNRSIFAAEVMQKMGYQHVVSLQTGLRGWNEFEQVLVDKDNREVSLDDADDYFTAKVHPEQRRPPR